MEKRVENNLTQALGNSIVWILFVAYIVLSEVVLQLFNIETSRLSGIIVIVPVFLMLAIKSITSGGKIGFEFSYYHKYILFFGLFCILSSMWSQSSELSISKGIDIIEIAIIMMVISICFRNTDTVDQLLKGIMWAFYIIVLYEIIFYGRDYFVQTIEESSRLSSEFLNSNTLGMCASFAVIINLYLILSKKIAVWTFAWNIVCVFVIAASGSRKALVSLCLGIFLYFFTRSFRKPFPFVKLLIAIPIITIIVYQILQLSLFNGIMERTGDLVNIITPTSGVHDKSVLIRMALIQLGMKLFIDHPLLGVGIDNPRLYTYDVVGDTFYLHNNFVEMLASGGALGTIMYYSIYIKLLFSYIKRRDFDDPQYCVCITLMFLTLLLDYGMVSYYSKLTYIYLFLFVKYDEKLKQKRRGQILHE